MKFECDVEKKIGVKHPAFLRVGISSNTHVTILAENTEESFMVYLTIEDARQFAYEVLKHKQMLQQINENEKNI